MKRNLSMLIVPLFLIFSHTALAGDWNFYGSARMATFWTDYDLTDKTDMDTSLQSNARIGARVKVSDELQGQFEYGAKNGNANIRYLYGEWHFGAGSLLVGQYETPLNMAVSNQVFRSDNGMEGWGEASPGRNAQICLTWGGFKIAAVEATANYLDGAGSAVVDTDTEQVIPRLEASYTTAIDNLTLGLGGGFSTFEYDKKEDVDAYLGMICAKYRYQGFALGGQFFAGQNVGNIITADTTGDDLGKGYAKIQSGRVMDNDAMGFEVVAGYIINDVFALEAGYGYMQTEYEDAEDDEVCACYLQTPITFAPGVMVVPEIGMVDYEETGQDEVTYVGAKWQINF